MPTLPRKVIVNGEPRPEVTHCTVSARRVSIWDATARYTARVILHFADTPAGAAPPHVYWAERVEFDVASGTYHILGAIEEPPPVYYETPGGLRN